MISPSRWYAAFGGAPIPRGAAYLSTADAIERGAHTKETP